MSVYKKDKTHNKGRKELSKLQFQQIKQAFDLFDANNEKQINSKQLKLAMRALGIQIKKDQLKKIISEYDKDNKGSIQFDDYVELMTNKITERDPRQQILKIFNLFDLDSKGKITHGNLKKIAQNLGQTISDQQINEMMAEIDKDGDGVINEEDFTRVMKKTNLF